MKCPHCKENVLQKASDGGAKVRTDGPILFDAEGNATARCFWCKSTVKLPIELKKSVIEERFVIGTAAKPGSRP